MEHDIDEGEFVAPDRGMTLFEELDPEGQGLLYPTDCRGTSTFAQNITLAPTKLLQLLITTANFLTVMEAGVNYSTVEE